MNFEMSALTDRRGPCGSDVILAPVRGAQGFPATILSNRQASSAVAASSIHLPWVVISSAAVVTTISQELCTRLGYTSSPLSNKHPAYFTPGGEVTDAALIKELTVVIAGEEITLSPVMVYTRPTRQLQFGVDLLKVTGGEMFIEFQHTWLRFDAGAPTPSPTDVREEMFQFRAASDGTLRTVLLEGRRSAPHEPATVGALLSRGDEAPCAGCGIVFGGLRRCSLCHDAQYCTKDCQVEHWPTHRTVCSGRLARKAAAKQKKSGGG